MSSWIHLISSSSRRWSKWIVDSFSRLFSNRLSRWLSHGSILVQNRFKIIVQNTVIQNTCRHAKSQSQHQVSNFLKLIKNQGHQLIDPSKILRVVLLKIWLKKNKPVKKGCKVLRSYRGRGVKEALHSELQLVASTRL